MKTLITFLATAAVVSFCDGAHYSVRANSSDDEDYSQDLDWWEHGVFYQIYPRSFKDSDHDGNGDLQGIIDNFDHFKDLGVTGIWLSSIFLSPMKDGGYDVQDFKTVNPMFGTDDDLKALFEKAKEAGIKILLDFVPNHTSNQHEWFQKSRASVPGFESFYIWENCPLVNPDGPEDGPRRFKNNWIALYHTPAWTYDDVRKQCYLHQFTPEQPDLNYRNEEVYNNMLEILEYWLEQGVDGFRIDSANRLFEIEGLYFEEYVNTTGDRTRYDNLRHANTVNQPESYQFVYDLRKMMDDFSYRKDNVTRLLMTEAYAPVEEQAKWYGRTTEEQGAHVPSNFVMISNLNGTSNAQQFDNAIYSWLEAMPGYGNANWVLGNHNQPRLGTRFGEKRHESLVILSMMLPGINVIYYGEEIGMINNFDISFAESDDPQVRQTNESVFMEFTRDPARTPFQWDDSEFAGFSDTTHKTWLPIHENHKTLNLKAQKEADKSTFKLYKDLIKLRKDSQVLQIGGYSGKVVDEKVFGFMRTFPGRHTIAVLVNLGGATTVSLEDLFETDFSDKTKAKILIANNESKHNKGDSVSDVRKIELGDFDTLVFEVSKSARTAVSLTLLLLILCILRYI